MRNIRWLASLFLCLMLLGCGRSESDCAAQEDETALEACGAAAPAEAQEETVAETTASAKSQSRSYTYTYTGNKENMISDGLTYFTFVEKNITHTNDEGDMLLQEVLTQTSFFSECPIQTEWVNEIISELQSSDASYGKELLEYAKRDQKASGNAFYFHSHYVSRGIARHDDYIISLLSLTSVYSGGMYPYMTQTSFNLDMKELKTLLLEDVIEPDGCLALYDLVLQKVEEKFSTLGESGLHDNYKKIISDAVSYGKMTPYWYFNDKGLVIFFNQYELAQYAAGIIKVELEYSALEGILKEAYFPAEINGGITNISVDQDLDGKAVYDVNLGEGETVYITVGGNATQVQLSEVSFIENTAVDSTMLFSANRLNQDTPLAVTINLDPDIIYAIEYYDETGGPKILYLKDNIIQTDLQ